jgi:hypothetical protein
MANIKGLYVGSGISGRVRKHSRMVLMSSSRRSENLQSMRMLYHLLHHQINGGLYEFLPFHDLRQCRQAMEPRDVVYQNVPGTINIM